MRWLESPSFAWALGAGSFTSLTFLFEQSKGAGLALGLGLGLWVVAVLDRQRSPWRRAPLAGLAAGIAWPLLVTLVYFGTQHSRSLMLADWFWPLQHYAAANRVPYGYQNWSDSTRHMLFGSGLSGVRLLTGLAVSPVFLIPVLPLVAVALLAYWTVKMWGQQAAPAKCAYYVLVSATLSGLLLSVVIVRADIVHFMYLEPLFGLVLAWVVDGRDIPGQIFTRVRPLLNALVVITFLLMSLALLLRSTSAPYQVETRRGLVTMPGHDTVIEYVQAHVALGEKILVYPYLPLYYYLTETFSPTRYEYFQPGMHTAQQSREIVSQVASQRIRAVLFEVSFTDKIPTSWPGTPLKAIANDPVADYILETYRACRVLKSPRNWRFLFMVRKDLACP